MSDFNNNKKRKYRLSLKVIVATAAMTAALAIYAPAHAQPAAGDEITLEVNRFEVVGDNPLGNAETDATLAPHLGVHRSLATLEAAAKALEAKMRDRGYSFHRVIVPAQRPTGGVVKLEVLQFPLDSVEVTGQQNFSAANIRRSMPGLKPGPTPDVRKIASQLALANEHPSKRLTIVLKESQKADALDAEIRVRDIPPKLFFASLTGNPRDTYNEMKQDELHPDEPATAKMRLFDRDHALTFTYTTSPDHFDSVQQYGLFYSLPFYGYNTSVQVYYLNSDVNTGTIGVGATAFDVSGRGAFLGSRVNYSLPKWHDFSHQVSLALDDKHFQSNVSFFGTQLPNTDTHSRPLSLRYVVRSEGLWGSASAYADIARNMGGGSNNDDISYNAARLGATSDWIAVHFGADLNRPLGAWNLAARLRGQYSDSPLIPGEQFGLGGVNTVRGLREREYTGDTGYALSLEATGPAIKDTLKPVLFFDYGHAALRDNGGVPGLVTSESASSVGAGLRWNRDRKLDVAADLAYVIDGTAGSTTVPGTDYGHVKLNFTVFYRF